MSAFKIKYQEKYSKFSSSLCICWSHFNLSTIYQIKLHIQLKRLYWCFVRLFYSALWLYTKNGWNVEWEKSIRISISAVVIFVLLLFRFINTASAKKKKKCTISISISRFNWINRCIVISNQKKMEFKWLFNGNVCE